MTLPTETADSKTLTLINRTSFSSEDLSLPLLNTSLSLLSFLL